MLKGAKYTKWTALPLALFSELGKTLNIYFILVTVLTWSPNYSPKEPTANTITVVVILLLKVWKDVYDDRQRQKVDEETNSELIKRYNHKHMVFN